MKLNRYFLPGISYSCASHYAPGLTDVSSNYHTGGTVPVRYCTMLRIAAGSRVYIRLSFTLP